MVSKYTKEAGVMDLKKKICIFCILVAASILALLVSCQTKDAGGDTKNTGDMGELDQTDSGGAAEQTTEKLVPELPEADYGGHKFTFLAMNDIDGFLINDTFAQEMNGDVINDAKYARNIYVEDSYGVKIDTVNIGFCKMGSGVSAVKKSSAAGDFTYDATILSAYDTCTLVTEGLLCDLNNMPPLDLSKPWWDQKANEDLAIKGKMYFTTGDMSPAMKSSTSVMFFNKKHLQDYGLEDPYALVKSGKWTYDKLIELSKAVQADLNGDGIFDENDLYGTIAMDDTMMDIVNSIGEKCARINSGGEIEVSLYNERVLAVFNKYTDFAYDSTLVFPAQRYAGKVGDYTGIIQFQNSQSLFFPYGVKLAADMRSMETDFGILPFPKLDEGQNRYYSPIIAWWSLFVSAPALQENAERTAVILEALAAESHYGVNAAYYDISLKGKYARDEESSEMLDIIFDTRIYDFGWYYQIGDYNNVMLNLFRNYNREFTSMYEKNIPKAEKDVQKINGRFSEILG